MIVLASQSPRRKELLQQVTEDFLIHASEIDEKAIEARVLEEGMEDPFQKTASQLVETLAAEKARVVLKQHPEDIIIGADTVVVHEDQVLGKPIDEADAFRMLRSYAGKTHFVITGVSVQSRQKEVTFSVKTEVTFWEWSKQMEKEVRAYIESGSPMDKAGAYGIQEQPSLWVKEIHGDYLNVIGLPVAYLHRALQEFSIYS
ncbi:Maf family protein [Jeotgalibaca caeni]|uniref:Maf family protein n=1 Tax=Jeotgalibaca caeni TaxID=3028623 RepID=UPI00237DBAFA|nr:Maf family protein [Jeotgalibaca caeni]MDE1548612.1 Maf family protein [Jeotgalibaca caeni]